MLLGAVIHIGKQAQSLKDLAGRQPIVTRMSERKLTDMRDFSFNSLFSLVNHVKIHECRLEQRKQNRKQHFYYCCLVIVQKKWIVLKVFSKLHKNMH